MAPKGGYFCTQYKIMASVKKELRVLPMDAGVAVQLIHRMYTYYVVVCRHADT